MFDLFRPPKNRSKPQGLTPGLIQKKRNRFCDNRIRKKSLKHKSMNHLNTDIFEFRKKINFIGPSEPVSGKMSF